MKREYLSIQYLRGLAAIMVLIAHSAEHPLPFSTSAFLKTGRFGVDIFFVISGFIITMVCGQDTFNPAEFAKRRFIRVVPLYWIYTTLVASFALLVPAIFKSTQFDLSYYLHSLAFVPYADPIPPHAYEPIFKLGWTLEYEIFFYLVMGCLFFIRGGARVAILVAIMGTLIGLGAANPDYHSFVGFYANMNLTPFAAGAVLGYLTQRDTWRGVAAHHLWIATVAMTAALIWFCTLDWSEVGVARGHFVMDLAAVLIIWTALLAEARGKLFYNGALKLFGDASYSLYLAHMFAVGTVWSVGARLFHPAFLSPAYFVVTAAGIAAGLVAGLASYFLLERPILHWRKPRVRSLAPA